MNVVTLRLMARRGIVEKPIMQWVVYVCNYDEVSVAGFGEKAHAAKVFHHLVSRCGDVGRYVAPDHYQVGPSENRRILLQPYRHEQELEDAESMLDDMLMTDAELAAIAGEEE